MDLERDVEEGREKKKKKKTDQLTSKLDPAMASKVKPDTTDLTHFASELNLVKYVAAAEKKNQRFSCPARRRVSREREREERGKREREERGENSLEEGGIQVREREEFEPRERTSPAEIHERTLPTSF